MRELGEAIVHKDIYIVSPPGFSSRFQLRSSEEENVRALPTSGLLSYLEGLDPNRKCHVEGCGLTLVIYRLGNIVKSEKSAPFVEETTRIAKAFFTLSGLKTLRP
jgi:hypothetical protein